jgi:hypothetical protein
LLPRNLPASPATKIDAEGVIYRLEEAGRALLSLPRTGPSTRLVQSGLEWVREASGDAAPSRGRIRPPVPDAAMISRMDQALAWIPLIPIDRYVLRRVVGARSLINPSTDRHLYTWRRLALAVGADHKAVQRWHAQGIDMIVAALSQPAHMRKPTSSLPPKGTTITAGRLPRRDATGRS